MQAKRRLARLEDCSSSRKPIRFLWNDGQPDIDRQEAQLIADGFDVIRVGWLGREEDAQS